MFFPEDEDNILDDAGENDGKEFVLKGDKWINFGVYQIGGN